MLQDVMRGRRTEIDQLNGYVSAPGRRLGLPTPYNDAIVALVTAQPVGRLRPDPARIAPSLEMPG
jgi:2-dehydropantoate 2-reductase